MPGQRISCNPLNCQSSSICGKLNVLKVAKGKPLVILKNALHLIHTELYGNIGVHTSNRDFLEESISVTKQKYVNLFDFIPHLSP